MEPVQLLYHGHASLIAGTLRNVSGDDNFYTVAERYTKPDHVDLGDHNLYVLGQLDRIHYVLSIDDFRDLVTKVAVIPIPEADPTHPLGSLVFIQHKINVMVQYDVITAVLVGNNMKRVYDLYDLNTAGLMKQDSDATHVNVFVRTPNSAFARHTLGADIPNPREFDANLNQRRFDYGVWREGGKGRKTYPKDMMWDHLEASFEGSDETGISNLLRLHIMLGNELERRIETLQNASTLPASLFHPDIIAAVFATLVKPKSSLNAVSMLRNLISKAATEDGRQEQRAARADGHGEAAAETSNIAKVIAAASRRVPTRRETDAQSDNELPEILERLFADSDAGGGSDTGSDSDAGDGEL